MDRQKLIDAGIDYDAGVERFSGHSEIYEKYLKKFFEGSMMETLEKQLSEKDIPGAFRTVHDLKGAAGNLSLNELYEKVCELTELLRHGEKDGDYSGAFMQIKTLYDTMARATKE